MATWRVRGEINFMTVAARTAFINAATAFKATHPVIFDRSWLIAPNPDEPEITGPGVRLDFAFVAEQHGLDLVDAVEARGHAGVERVRISAHHCSLGGAQDVRPVRYFEWP